jgi:hypothetical protein
MWLVYFIYANGKPGRYGWVRADDLAVDDYLVPAPKKAFNAEERIVSIKPLVLEASTAVFDVTVEEDHSFVAGGLITHNCYGMMPPKLVVYARTEYGVVFTLAQSREVWEHYFEAYAGVKQWHGRELDRGKQSKVSRSIGGRLRHMNPDDHNALLNNPIQSTGADGLKAALRNVYDGLKRAKISRADARMVHHVHDEILLEVRNDPELIQTVKAILEPAMMAGMQQFLTKVPVKVDAHHGRDWAEAKG